jgi:hypothetical protein
VGDHESPEMRMNSSCRDSRRRIRRCRERNILCYKCLGIMALPVSNDSCFKRVV